MERQLGAIATGTQTTGEVRPNQRPPNVMSNRRLLLLPTFLTSACRPPFNQRRPLSTSLLRPANVLARYAPNSSAAPRAPPALSLAGEGPVSPTLQAAVPPLPPSPAAEQQQQRPTYIPLDTTDATAVISSSSVGGRELRTKDDDALEVEGVKVPEKPWKPGEEGELYASKFGRLVLCWAYRPGAWGGRVEGRPLSCLAASRSWPACLPVPLSMRSTSCTSCAIVRLMTCDLAP